MSEYVKKLYRAMYLVETSNTKECSETQEQKLVECFDILNDLLPEEYRIG